MEEEMYKKAYKELYTILEHTDEETLKQIPEKFMDLIKSKMNEEHEFTVNEEKSLSEQEILDETKHLLEIVRKNYLVQEEVQTPEVQAVVEKTEIKTETITEADTQEVEVNEEVNIKSVNEEVQELNVASIEENTEATGLMVVKPRNIFIRLIEKLKAIFVRSKGKVDEE